MWASKWTHTDAELTRDAGLRRKQGLPPWDIAGWLNNRPDVESCRLISWKRSTKIIYPDICSKKPLQTSQIKWCGGLAVLFHLLPVTLLRRFFVLRNGWSSTPIFIAALFITARTWKQPRCPSADEWIRKLWYIHTMEYYSAITKNSFESVLMRWMKLEPIIQSEVSQKDKDHYSILTHIYGI